MEMSEKILELKHKLLSKIQDGSINGISVTQIQEGLNFFFADEIETLPEEEFWEKYRNINMDLLLHQYSIYIQKLITADSGV